MSKLSSTLALSACLCAAAVVPAEAQKAKDTLRHIQVQAVATVSYYFDPQPEVQFLTEAAYDNLIMYDFHNGAFAPLLASAWKTVGDNVYEFTLRDDVKWSDGAKFSADDVVFTFNWLLDPNTKIRFRDDWDILEKVEKIGPNQVRLTTKSATPYTLAQLASKAAIMPQHVYAKLVASEYLGAPPIGTGPYRFVQVDKNKGAIAVKRDDYVQAGPAKPMPTIGRLEVRGAEDSGARVAELLAGNTDLIKDVPVDQAEALTQRPGLKVTETVPFSYFYLMLDAKGRSGVKPLTDLRVRQAILHAIDTRALNKLVGGGIASFARPEALCLKLQRGCAYTQKQLEYDPATAKKLLAEAGYAQGFDVEIITKLGPGEPITEAISGQLRAVGIRASVSTQSFAAYRKIQTAGKQQALVSGWAGGNMPDVNATASFFFTDALDYHGHPEWIATADEASKTMDDAKRRQLMQKVFDGVTKEAYMATLTPFPNIWVHSADLEITKETPPFFSYGLTMSDLSWRK